MYFNKVSAFLWRVTSMILLILARTATAQVTNPARSEWPEYSCESSPIIRAWRFHPDCLLFVNDKSGSGLASLSAITDATNRRSNSVAEHLAYNYTELLSWVYRQDWFNAPELDRCFGTRNVGVHSCDT